MHAKGEREIKITQGLDVIAVLFRLRYGIVYLFCCTVHLIRILLLLNCVFK